VSIITDRDICMAAYLQGRPLSEIPAASAMSRRLVTIRETATVSVAEAAMRRHGVRRLLVVDAAGRLVGLLSIDDILKRAGDGPVRSTDPFSGEAIAATVAALGYAYAPARG
jgi:CBS domain-containing protein